MADGLTQEPRVAPAMLAGVFSRPDGAAGRVFQRYFPRVLDSVGAWLSAEVRAGRIRPLALPLLIQQLIGPLAVHLLLRPVLTCGPGSDLPSVEDACVVFADAFVRAVTVSQETTG
ncbi:MAG: hypothetical protein ACRDR6_10440 [Pseudonocardiaceae bacterium]